MAFNNSVILKTIKKRKSIRAYKDKSISRVLLDKIIEAGAWGPSIHGLQPWKFIVITSQVMIARVSNVVNLKAKKINIPGFILYPTIKALSNAKVIICVYNTKKFTNFVKKIHKKYLKKAIIVELSAISAAIQNMILTAESLKVGAY